MPSRPIHAPHEDLTDFTTGRTLFADDIVSFGTWTTLMSWYILSDPQR
jgi:hypothetical protein